MAGVRGWGAGRLARFRNLHSGARNPGATQLTGNLTPSPVDGPGVGRSGGRVDMQLGVYRGTARAQATRLDTGVGRHRAECP